MKLTNIMIVDDALFMRQLVRNTLIEYGFNIVAEASNGEEAIEQYFKVNPDLMICDIVMPQKNGLDALKEIIAQDQNAKIIMLSAIDEQETVINALHLGAKDYMVKPIQKTNFIRTVRRVLEEGDLENDSDILVEVFIQIIEDVFNYIDSRLSKEIHSQISYILKSVEIKYPESFVYDEKTDRISLRNSNTLSFIEINDILIEKMDRVKEKIEQYIPYAKNILTETFRFVYLRNKSKIKNIGEFRFPEWLASETIFVDQIMDYLFH